MNQADLCTWEATYDDGRIRAERAGHKYHQLERERISTFRIVAPGEVLFETWPPPGATGQNLIYRRRTTMGTSKRSVVFVVAWVPYGPVHLIDPDGGRVHTQATFTSGLAEAPMIHPHEKVS